MKMRLFCAITGSFVLMTATGEIATCDAVKLAMSEDGSLATITYSLSGAPAVITLDLETNTLADATGDWVSIGGAAASFAQGDVWKRVEPDEAEVKTITWLPKKAWPNHCVADKCLRASVSAWTLNDTPDYMVMSLTKNSERIRYYPDVDYLPGGLLKNEAYRTTSLVMRRIHAKGITWKMGSDETIESGYRDTDGRETQHDVTLDHDYYIAVFPITQQQYQLVSEETGDVAYRSYYTRERRMRPVERIAYIRIRTCDVTKWEKDHSSYDYPNDPHPGSFLGRLRAISKQDGGTEIDFDLPGEAEWEYACRAGHGDGFWGDGSVLQSTTTDKNLMRLTRCLANQVNKDADSDPATGGTAIVGTYEPNSWGVYDMHGNVGEYCLDFWKKDITGRSQGEIVTRDEADDGESLQRRGCDPANARYHRSAQRGSRPVTYEDNGGVGFRVACRAGLN